MVEFGIRFIKSSMEEGGLQILNTLGNHFRDMTTQFIWDGSVSKSVATTILSQCILIECISISYDSGILEKSIRRSNPKKDNTKIRDQTYQHILSANAKIFRTQRFNPAEFILILDSIFPSKTSSETHGIQTSTNELNIYMHNPSVILVETVASHFLKSARIARQVAALYSSTLLLFIDTANDYVRMGNFAGKNGMEYFRDKKRQLSSYLVTLEEVPISVAASMENILRFWKKLHSKVSLAKTTPPGKSDWNCRSNDQYPANEECMLYKYYFQYINCTDVLKCLLLYRNLLDLKHGFHPNFDNNPHRFYISSYSQRQLGYYLQIVFPKENFPLENRNVLCPFEYNFWLPILSVVVTASVWLILIRREKVRHVTYPKTSVATTESRNLSVILKAGYTKVAIIWIFSAVFLCQFYASSLHSVVTFTADKIPPYLPTTIEQLSNRDDFDILARKGFSHNFYIQFLAYWYKKEAYLPNKTEEVYTKIVLKSSYVGNWYFRKTLRNIAEGKYEHVQFVQRDHDPKHKPLGNLLKYKLQTKNVTFRQFAALQETYMENVIENERLIFGHTKLQSVIPKPQKVFYKAIYLWTQRFPNFATFHLVKFLGSFVQSGLHDRELIIYQKVERWRDWKKLNRKSELGISNGQLFSQIFMIERVKSRYRPPTHISMSTLSKGFYLGCMIFTAAAAWLLGELLLKILKMGLEFVIPKLEWVNARAVEVLRQNEVDTEDASAVEIRNTREDEEV
ncbi:unnamed protein product [Orchesella dallaii]|uniref:Uncharacterized protein n=1 Tax=Orchesella dallaii TaxID=48710 RepID=A0ABP1QV32_9HEXA